MGDGFATEVDVETQRDMTRRECVPSERRDPTMTGPGDEHVTNKADADKQLSLELDRSTTAHRLHKETSSRTDATASVRIEMRRATTDKLLPPQTRETFSMHGTFRTSSVRNERQKIAHRCQGSDSRRAMSVLSELRWDEDQCVNATTSTLNRHRSPPMEAESQVEEPAMSNTARSWTAADRAPLLEQQSKTKSQADANDERQRECVYSKRKTVKQRSNQW